MAMKKKDGFRWFVAIAVIFALFSLFAPVQANGAPLIELEDRITASVEKELVSFHTGHYRVNVLPPLKVLIYYLFDKTAITINLAFLLIYLLGWDSRVDRLVKQQLLHPIKFTSTFVDGALKN
jgi:hypothetical protein